MKMILPSEKMDSNGSRFLEITTENRLVENKIEYRAHTQ